MRRVLWLSLSLAVAAYAGRASAAPPSCKTRFDCTHGFACTEGQCVPPECTSDSQCGGGRYCDAAGACKEGAPAAPASQAEPPPGPPPPPPAPAAPDAPAPEAARADDEPPTSRFYWHEALGVGVVSGESSFRDGTRAFTSFTGNFVTTAGARLARSIAIGGTMDLYFMAPTTVVEERSLGHKELSAPFGIAGLIGPSAVLIPSRFRFEFSPGFFWCVLAHAESHSAGPSLGGFGFGGSVAAAYDVLLRRRIALGIEGRTLVGAYGNSDVTHTGGFAAAGTVLVSLRAR